jgi:hypothetical protein
MIPTTRSRELDGVGATEHQSVRGDLHRAGLVTGLEHPAERALQIDRLGRGALDLLQLAADHLPDGAEQPTPHAGGLEHVPNQEGRRGLPVGPRYPDHGEL